MLLKSCKRVWFCCKVKLVIPPCWKCTPWSRATFFVIWWTFKVVAREGRNWEIGLCCSCHLSKPCTDCTFLSQGKPPPSQFWSDFRYSQLGSCLPQFPTSRPHVGCSYPAHRDRTCGYAWEVEATNTFQPCSHKHGKGVHREGQKLHPWDHSSTLELWSPLDGCCLTSAMTDTLHSSTVHRHSTEISLCLRTSYPDFKRTGGLLLSHRSPTNQHSEGFTLSSYDIISSNDLSPLSS